MNITCKLILILLLIQITTRIKGQFKTSFDPVTIASPNAASVGIYGQIPVDYYTGVPNISIPIYTLKEGNIIVPISLSYHGSGVKPNQYPSWVGQNWTLFAGGAITRIIKGRPDEMDKGSLQVAFNLGYFYNTSYLAANNWTQFVFANKDQQEIDTEPDEFSFNVNGISGKFYLDHLGQWQVLCDKDIKVVCTSNDIKDINYDYDNNSVRAFVNGNMFFKFILIDDNGTKYIFGNRRSAIEFTRPENPTGKLIPIPTTWNLTEIVSLEGNRVEFEYERNKDDLILYIYRTFNITDFTLYNQSKQNIGPSKGSKILEPSYLKSIKTTNQKIVFTSVKSSALSLVETEIPYYVNVDMAYKEYYKDIISQNNIDATYSCSLSDLKRIGRKLSKIDIYNDASDNATVFKSYIFNYIENTQERLKLESMEEQAQGVLNKPKYSFEYYPTSANLPYITNKVDHWGFYNNLTPLEPNCCYSDFIKNQKEAYYNSRIPTNDPNVYLFDMLKKIIYPTKGYTTFEYQPHDYSSVIYRRPIVLYGKVVGLRNLEAVPLTSKLIGGGLRVKKIINHSDIGSDITREFYYINNFSSSDDQNSVLNKLSSGQLTSEVLQTPDYNCMQQYENCLNQQVYCEDECLRLYKNDDDACYNCILNCPQCSDFCLRSNFYSNYFKEGAFYENSTVVGHFQNFTSNPNLPLTDNAGNHIVYGKVIEKTNGYSIYTYNLPSSGSSQNLDELPLSVLNNSFYAELTSRLTERNKLTSLEVYNSNGLKMKDVNYFYNSDPNRFNKKIRTRSLYANKLLTTTDLIADDVFGSSNYIYYYNSYLEKQIETTFSESGNNPISKTTEYKYNDLRLLIEERTINSIGENMLITYKYPNDFMSNNITKSMLTQYHKINSPVEIVRKKNDKVVESIINKYLCKNCEFNSTTGLYSNGFPGLSQILKLESTEGITNYQSATSSLIPDSRCTPRFTIDDYDNYGNVIQFHKENDLNSAFIWGYNNKFPIVKGENISYTVLNAAYSSAMTSSGITDFSSIINPGFNDSQRNTLKSFIQALRSNITLSNALLSVYTYSPVLGMTSMTDPNGVTTYYEYDNLGRLKCIKDDDGRILKTYEYNYKQ